MENLKITFSLSSPVILSRYTTVDSILLSLYFNKQRRLGILGNGFVDTKDFLPEIAKFLEVKNNTISGSVWYVDKDEDVSLYNAMFVKTRDKEHMIRYASIKENSIEDGRGEYKLYRFGIEALNIKNLYFYVSGDKRIISELLSGLRGLGKKNSVGYGLIKDFKIEVIKEDKGFILDKNTPSKPLACKNWYINSHKVMFYRQYPPYHVKSGKVPCYMPTTALIEVSDITYHPANYYKSLKSSNYISPSEFVYNAVKDIVYYTEKEVKDENTGKKKILVNISCKKREYPQMAEKKVCGACGKIHDKGATVKESFGGGNDYGFVDTGDFICEYCDWSREQDIQNYAGYLFTDEKGFRHLQGKHMTESGSNEKETKILQQEFRTRFFSKLKDLKPPFYIGIKTTKNQQHVVYKGVVSISNALIPIQHGNDTCIVDAELLNDAITELNDLIEKTGLTKTFWTNQEIITASVFTLPTGKDTLENRKLLSDFYKKYDRSIRIFLNRAVIK